MIRLPYADIDGCLRALSGKAEGFGRHAIGGIHGALYIVTNLNDDGCGSLREACRRKEPLWIVFEVSGTIHLSSILGVSSYKTIDGRGQKVKLTGKGLKLKECEHVIICNLELEGGRGHDADGIQIKPRSRHIWIDRCSLCDFDDGLIDITQESTDITISRCHFAKHNKTLIIGACCSNIGDQCITIHHCFFDGTTQRHPRVRFAKVHLYNNYTRNWGIYAVCAGVESQIISQCNIYEAGKKEKVFKYLPETAADKQECDSGWIKSEGDLFLNDAQPCLLEDGCRVCSFEAHKHCQAWTMESASADLKEALLVCTGWQPIPRPRDTNHPWLQSEFGETARARLKQFSVMNKLKKRALKVVVEHLSFEEVADIKDMFKKLDINTGRITFRELRLLLVDVYASYMDQERLLIILAWEMT